MRRYVLLILVAMATLVPALADAAEAGPVEVVTAIYRRAATGKGDSGGDALWLRAQDRRVNFTRRTAELWDRADRVTPKGDQGAPEFDPVTASQDPFLQKFALATEEVTPDRARILVRLFGYDRKEAYASVRYHFVRADGLWLIDDISGSTDGHEWSIRDILQDHLASYAKPRGRASRGGARR